MATGPLARLSVEELRARFEELLNARDADALVPYWADDLVEEFPVGTYRGRDAVRGYVAEMFAAVPDLRVKTVAAARDGDIVFVRWHLTGTFSGGKWLGIEPTGAPLDLEGIDCFTIRGGFVVNNFVMYDQVAFARQIGMMPPAASLSDRLMKTTFNARTKLRRRLGRATASSSRAAS